MIASRLSVVCSLLLAALFTVGCGGGEEAQIPEALSLSEAPNTLEEAFANAAADAKGEAQQAAAALNSGDYGRALMILQQLTARPELTGPQRELATRSLLTAQQETAKAAEAGDQDLQRLMRYRSANK
ncbi:MAG TPA: hypothetical protein VLD18_12335 [Verrucomicrobiae bacterium]|nr:hypothetical protein [Verrucomicrobiae bacterium]